MNKEQSVTLLRQNKRKQVEVLQSLGFAGVTNATRASLFPDYIKWAGGLLDVRVAIVRIADGAKFYLTIQEWESLTNENQAKFVKQGVRVRAECEDFIVAAVAPGTFAWGSNKDVTTAPNYGESSGSTTYKGALDALGNPIDALTLTQRISDYYGTATANSVTGAPAANAALSYKAFKQATDGIDDDADWCLPNIKHAMILYRYKNVINDVFRRAWSSDNILTTAALWTCIEASANNAWIVNIGSGYVFDPTKVTAYTVRPITLLNT